VTVATDYDLINVGRVTGWIAELNDVLSGIEQHRNRRREWQVATAPAQVERNIRTAVDINDEGTGSVRHAVYFQAIHAGFLTLTVKTA